MKKLSILLSALCLAACNWHEPKQDADNTMDVDENLVASTMEADYGVPKDVCGRETLLADDNKYYTVNPDGSLSPGIIEGMPDKKRCKELIRTNNGARLVRVQVN